MKGGAWLALQAFAAAAHGGLARRPLTFLFSSDEETGSASTRGLIEDLGRTSAAVLVTEPGRDGGKVVTGRKGVGRFDVHVEGRPSHAGTRHADGRNAIREAARLILEIEGLTDYARGVTTTVGTILGGTAENVVPQHCRFAVDLRVVTAADGQDYAGRILGLRATPDFRVTVTGGMNRPPYDAAAGARSTPMRRRSPATSSGSTSARCRSPAAARTATSRRLSASRPSTGSASTATGRTRSRNTA